MVLQLVADQELAGRLQQRRILDFILAPPPRTLPRMGGHTTDNCSSGRRTTPAAHCWLGNGSNLAARQKSRSLPVPQKNKETDDKMSVKHALLSNVLWSTTHLHHLGHTSSSGSRMNVKSRKANRTTLHVDQTSPSQWHPERLPHPNKPKKTL